MSNTQVPKQHPGRVGYTDEQLCTALRDVITKSRYQDPSMDIYRDERPAHYPDAGTIADRFGSWDAAKREAMVEENSR